MPYRFEKKKIKLPVEADRRRKLTEGQRNEIFESGESQRELARIYGVSRKTIANIKYPERYAAQLKDRAGRWREWYDKEKHRECTYRHRRYKAGVLKTSMM